MRATRHNGRSGKHGVYNPKHNDRKFDIANSEHIDAEREKQNIYWDCYRGYVQNPSDETLRDWGPVEPEASFHDIEKMYYEDHYSDFIKGQNARNDIPDRKGRGAYIGRTAFSYCGFFYEKVRGDVWRPCAYFGFCTPHG